MFEGIKNKKALVTGASSGIGGSIAEILGEYGASVGLHYSTGRDGVEKVSKAMEARGGECKLFQADLLEEGAPEQLIKSFVESFEGIDILVNNAGWAFGAADFLELDSVSWDKTFQLNTKAPFFLAREAFKVMKDEGYGKIINISSIAAKYGGSPTTMHYGASKAALDALTIGLARAGAPYNIMVNSIRPGVIDTSFHKKIGRENMDERIEMIPLKRAGQPIDIAQMALYLASEAGDFITGEIFTVAGGD